VALDEQIFLHATLRERFVAAAAGNDETATNRLQALVVGPEDLAMQREDAWKLLTAGTEWAIRALRSAGIEDTRVTRIDNSEAAFAQAQRFERQLFELSQLRDRPHDREARIVDSVKRACYAGAELGPVPGGRLAIPGTIVREIAPEETDLQDVGADLGEALRLLDELALGDVIVDASKALHR
jgi:hypothetical protein